METDYTIVETQYVGELITAVKDLQATGWECVGGPFITFTTYLGNLYTTGVYQAMVKRT